MLRPSLTLAAVVACASTLRAQAKPVVRHVQLRVAADDSAWMTTGLIVNEGDRIDVRATGTISVSRFWFRVEANGIRKGGGGERGSSYLEYRIGEELPKPAGKVVFLTADASGLLQFRVHDDNYDDNDGSLELDVLAVSGEAVPEATAPNEGNTDLASIIATMSNLLDVLTRVADESFSAKGFYPNPFLDPRVKLPDGITASRLSADAKGYTIGLQHFDKPKARCAISYRMRNPFDEKASDRETVCQWHDFDPAW